MNIVIILFLIVVATMFVVYLSEKNKTKWMMVYFYVNNIMWVINESEEYEELEFVRKELIEEYKLSKENADLCIENWRDKQWFSEQEFLKK